MAQKRPEEGCERYVAMADREALFHCPCTELVEACMELVSSPVIAVRAKVEGILKWYMKAIRYSAPFAH